MAGGHGLDQQRVGRDGGRVRHTFLGRRKIRWLLPILLYKHGSYKILTWPLWLCDFSLKWVETFSIQIFYLLRLLEHIVKTAPTDLCFIRKQLLASFKSQPWPTFQLEPPSFHQFALSSASDQNNFAEQFHASRTKFSSEIILPETDFLGSRRLLLGRGPPQLRCPSGININHHWQPLTSTSQTRCGSRIML